MAVKFAFKNIAEENRLIRQRVYFASFIIIILLLFLLARLSYLQVIKQDHFTTLSKNNRVKILPIPPTRGLIYSQDGILLADNRPAFTLEIVPEQIKDMEKLVQDLSAIVIITDEDIQKFRETLRTKRHHESIPIRYNLNEQEVARFSVNRHRFNGVEVYARPFRHYPLKDITAHVTGYVGRIDERDLASLDKSDYLGTTHIGKLGVEKAYEDLLHGSVGHQQVEINAQGRILRILEKSLPEPGKNIYLSLNVSLQIAAVEVMTGRRGAIVAMNPDNGEILALVSSPGYDPNPFVNGIDHNTYQALITSKDTPLVNRAIQGTYPPGSTIKPFLGAVALAYGVRNTEETTWCPGWFSLKGSTHRYRDWKKGGHGHVDLDYAIMQSCDVYYYSLANDLGIRRLHDGLTDFGFGKKTGIDISGESAGLVPSEEWKRSVYNQPWYQGETLIAGIGQGSLLSTPLQLALATASLANNGKLVVPHLAVSYRDPISNETGKITLPDDSEVPIYDETIWSYIKNAMVDVVHGERGTARRSGLNAAYRFAGKTGTAQVIGIAQDDDTRGKDVPEEFRDHALFIAYAPVEQPRIVLAILVENGGGGSATAAPIARQLLDHYLLDANDIQTDGRTITLTTHTH